MDQRACLGLSIKILPFILQFLSFFLFCLLVTRSLWVQRVILVPDHIQGHTHTHSVGLLWTSDRPVAETSAWQQTTHNRQTSISLAGLKPKIPADKRVQTHALERATTGIGQGKFCRVEYVCYIRHHIKSFADRIICLSPASLRHTEVMTVAMPRAPVE